MKPTDAIPGSIGSRVDRQRNARVRQLAAELEAELAASRLDRRRVRRLAFELQGHEDGMRRHLVRRLRASAGDEATAIAGELLCRPDRARAGRAWALARAGHVDLLASQARQVAGLIARAQGGLERSSLTRRVLRGLWHPSPPPRRGSRAAPEGHARQRLQ